MPYILESDRPLFDEDIKLVLKDDTATRKTLVEQGVDINAIGRLTEKIRNNGDLNYVISKIVWTLFLRNKRYAEADELMNDLDEVYDLLLHGGVHSNSLVFGLYYLCHKSVCKRTAGTVSCIKMEFYRRLVAPYEDTAIERNGDII